MYEFRGSDSYRPAGSSGPATGRGSSSRRDVTEFSFRNDEHAPRFPAQHGAYRPQSPATRNQPRSRAHHDFDRHDNRRSAHNNQNRRDFRRHTRAADRPLLRDERSSTPEPVLGLESQNSETVKFLPLGDVSDSEEEDMVLGSDDDGSKNRDESGAQTGDDTSRPKKKLRNESVKTRADGSAIPQWSNPDPYTVLPPVNDETHRKRRDIVKLIRKARVVSDHQNVKVSNEVTANEDFISFNIGLPGPGAVSDDTKIMFTEEKAPEAVADNGSALGSRKRTHDDQIKFGNKDKPVYRPDKLPFGRQGRGDNGTVTDEWKAAPNQNPTPWLTEASRGFERINPAYSLHREICDFYTWVRPQSWESDVRQSLIDRLQRLFESSPQFRGHHLYAFGSFVSGLHLPIADMDMVLLSPDYEKYGSPSSYMAHQACRNSVLKAVKILRKETANGRDIQPITGARVPIVKFIDKATGLKVDLSFNNTSGLVAINTFLKWKDLYPAMPPLVSIIKQFLLMRRYDDVSTGGLGGMSIICLVISLLQNLPSIQKGVLIPEQNLGEVLMEFLNLYGNHFDTFHAGIRMNPPGYFRKNFHNSNLPYQKDGHRLCIIDPNNPNNDVSAGSKNILDIFEAFAGAFTDLRQCMADPAQSGSLLGAIIGGDYSSYNYMRQRLKEYSESHPGLPSAISESSTFNFPSTGASLSNTKSSKGNSNGERQKQRHKNKSQEHAPNLSRESRQRRRR